MAMANLSGGPKFVGTMWEALQRLSAFDNDNWDKLTTYFQRIVNEPVYRRQVYLAMSGKLEMKEMTKDEWVEKERQKLSHLSDLGLKVGLNLSAGIAKSWQTGFGSHHLYVPAGLTVSPLLDASEKAGIKLYSKSIPSGGEELPTEEGVLNCELEKMMAPTNRHHHPFLLNFDEQVAWTKEEGGDGLTSVEETLYLILRAWVDLDRIPFMGGWIRCRNTCGSDGSLGVDWYFGSGLDVNYDGCDSQDWYSGAVPRKLIGI